jgi:adenylate kinase
MFRSAIAAGTELGKRVDPILARGELVPDDLTIAVLGERLGNEDAADGFVLDGFPRNLDQAEALDAMMRDTGRSFTAVLALQVPDAVARERMLKRGREENRPDDTPEVIARRLAIYHEQTEPLLEFYRTRGNFVPVHGDRAEGEVFAEIQKALEQAQEGAPA